jgi:hypothetical protein
MTSADIFITKLQLLSEAVEEPTVIDFELTQAHNRLLDLVKGATK